MTPRRALLALTAAAAVACATALVPPAAAAGDGLPVVDSGPRPGPDVLYAPPPRAPQLENTGVWAADPILVSGTQAYRDGEWLYQDYLLDDGGAAGVPDPMSPFAFGEHLFAPRAGTYTYPTDPAFARNGADLVELRVKPLADATAFRVSLNTLQDAERTAFTLALGTSEAALPWPHGAGVRSPAELFLTWHGGAAELVDAATGQPVTPAPTVRVDRERRQVEVRVPTSAWDPGTSTVRTAVGVGLWDPAAGTYLAPAAAPATETTPGGASPLQSAIVNVGPRFDEPQPEIRGKGYTIGDTAVAAAAEAAWWRELGQARALALGDVTPFAADVDFAALRAGTRDDSEVPTTGSFDRIFASRFSFGQGIDMAQICTDVSGGVDSTAQCKGRFVGQLQPYAVYVPDRPAPSGGYGLTLLMHSLSANYNQYANSANQSQLGERGAGSVVVTPAGRGPDGFYMGHTEADTFEVWADVARHYPIDPTWVAPTGYSMGGFGTYRLMARYPDLFGRGFSVVGIPGTVGDQLASLRNTPLLAWNGAADELVNLAQAEQAHAGLVEAGVPHSYDLFPTADHLTLASNDEYGLGAEFLGEARADRSPAQVTYVVDPREDNADAGVVADSAYWLSGLTVRDAEAGTGTVEVLSEAFGVGAAQPQPVAQDAGVLTGGAFAAMSFAERRVDLAPAATTPSADRLVVSATNVGRIVVDPARARITCDAELAVTSDGPVEVVLDGCNRSVQAPGGTAPGTAAAGGTAVAARTTAGALPATGVPAALPLLGLLLMGALIRRRR